MKFRFDLISKSKRFFLSPSIKEKTVNGDGTVGEFGVRTDGAVDSDFRYSDFGSKDEIFFDTKKWFDSDSEDEFVSVNGDFTPSRGNTPVHPLSTPRTQISKVANSSEELSPNDGKKKLFDLLKETNQSENSENFSETNGSDATKSLNGSPYILETNSTWSNQGTPNKNYKKEKTRRIKQCCFPNLYPSVGYSERRKPQS